MTINVGGSRHLGILAYGSLITSPGPEIASLTVERIKNVETPFKVEFARKSKTRGYAPTLIPVDSGGASVKAEIIVIKDHFAPDLAADMLRIEVEPCTGAAHDKGTGRFACIRISSATDEVSGGPVASKDDDHCSRRIGDHHDQRTHRGKEQSVEQPKKQDSEAGHHGGPELGAGFDAQAEQLLQTHQARRSHQYDCAENGFGQVMKERGKE